MVSDVKSPRQTQSSQNTESESNENFENIAMISRKMSIEKYPRLPFSDETSKLK